MKREKFFGILFIIFSLGVLAFNLKFTGAVVGVSYSGLNFTAIIFLVAGTAFFLHGNTLELLANKRFIDDPRKLKQIAEQLGYHTFKEAKEGTEISDDYGKILTVIPRRNITTGTYHSIKKALMSGESNFRRRYSA